MHWNIVLTGLFATVAASAMAQDAPAARANEQHDSTIGQFSATANTALDIGLTESEPISVAGPAVSEERPADGETLCAVPDAPLPRSEHILLSSGGLSDSHAEPAAHADSPDASIAASSIQTPSTNPKIIYRDKRAAHKNAAATESLRRHAPRSSGTVMRAPERQTPWYRTPYVALAGVLLLMGGLTVVFKRLVPSTRPMSANVMHTIGRLPLSPKQTATLLHIGRRIVLVAVGPDGARTLLEISDPEEVALLLGRAANSAKAAIAFKEALAEKSSAYEAVIEVGGASEEPATQDRRNETHGQLQGLLSKLRAFQTAT